MTNSEKNKSDSSDTGSDVLSDRERRIEGIPVSSGISIGKAYVVEQGSVQVAEYRLKANEIRPELARFDDAVHQSRRDIESLKAGLNTKSPVVAEEMGLLFDAMIQMLSGSRLVRGVEGLIREHKLNAEAAVSVVINEIGDAYAQIQDPYLASRFSDVRQAGNRIIQNLTKSTHASFDNLPRGSIIIAVEMTPADVAVMNPKRISGLATVLGGAQDHTSILARALGMPAVIGAPQLFSGVVTGDTVILDGEKGEIIVRPSEATRSSYEDRRDALRKEQRALARLRSLEAVTRDDVPVSLQANVELPIEVQGSVRAGCDGIGLFRTEFMFMNRDDVPSEDEQFEVIRSVVSGMEGRPVTVRTLDVGGDKLAPVFAQELEDAVNPALGLRAIRLALKVEPLLRTQLAAILRASVHGPLRIMLPLVTTAQEVRQVRKIMKEVAHDLRAKGVKIADALPPLGIMIEVPAAALAADALAMEAEFFSIGTNDLTMYTLAIDRGNEQVAHLYDPLNPAVLRLLQFSTAAAQRAGIDVAICGEMAGDERYTALLLGLGLRNLSMSAPSVSRVKRRIRSLDIVSAERRTQQIMDQSDSGRIRMLLDDFNEAMDLA